ncbi:uncharacterized protein with LGFP repeats [Agromyces sp. 3263]|uniref:LGFP repeat-containing protein n=1 Tax=Agromyces sp. 3263 TaxID=2817750 RepID=UPI00285F7CAB|nr:hypothetical protein [Agromyces sp. 3263]MDR6906530.1 uncharacterized protein with LGFP repeats [Agromyces sp. 3263]
MHEPNDRMTPHRDIGQARQAQAGLLPKRLDRAVSWSDFRTAVRYDPANRMLLAVPAISAKRAEHPWLGEAVTVHTRMGDAEVYRREYEHGAVYWSERTGAHEVHGEIAARWRAVGAERSFLGLPTTDVQRLLIDTDAAADDAPHAGGSGGFAHFRGGSVYWTPRHGAAIVHGMVRDIWALLGWERSPLGVPVADVVDDRATGAMSGCFEHGSITWSAARGPEVALDAGCATGEPGVDHESLDRLHSGFAPRA